ncbi:MAG: phosphatase PAP2 family protein [Desulfobacteraceae bacterium]|nr:MAG: phosphatase PAP2 family protein [Desulfobacteraceae bacterium]
MSGDRIIQRFAPFGKLKKIHFIAPILIVATGIASEYSGLDLLLIQPFFDASTGKWPYKSHWVASDVLHTGGKNFVVAIAAGIFLLFVLSFFVDRLKPFRKGAAYLLAASLAGPAIVSICKHTTHIYTPWDLAIFGGKHPYIRLFDAVPAGAKIGKAFPAGHSSGGFAFFSLYFLALAYKPSLRYVGLCFALSLGFIFGIAQQVRGAHFLSHDLFSLVVCWYCALITYLIFFNVYPIVNKEVST